MSHLFTKTQKHAQHDQLALIRFILNGFYSFVQLIKSCHEHSVLCQCLGSRLCKTSV